MTTEIIPNPDEETADIRQMRERIKDLTAENKTLTEGAKATAFKDAGFDPTTGVGALLAESYKGEYTAEAVATFAKEKGIETSGQPLVQKRTPEERLVAAGQNRLDAVNSGATPVNLDPSIDDQIAQADADGDLQKGITLRNLKLLAHEQRQG